MYNKLLDLIEEEKDLEVVKQLNVIKHRIDRGEPEDASIKEVYEYLCDEATASLDEKYLKTVRASVAVLEKIVNHVEEETNEVAVDLPQEEAVKEEKDEVEVNEDVEEEEHDCECGCGHDCKCNKEVGSCNKTAVALRTCIFIEGLIGYLIGVFMGFSQKHNPEYYSLAIMVTYWLATGFMILITIGLAEVIQILHDIRKNEENK